MSDTPPPGPRPPAPPPPAAPGRPRKAAPKSAAAPGRPERVFTLLVEVGRKEGDGLPGGATGAGLLCFSAGAAEAEAVREAVRVLAEAGLAPLEVTGHGTLEDRLAAGERIEAAERALMARALAENAVIVAALTTFGPEAEAAESGEAGEAGEGGEPGEGPPAPAPRRPRR